MLPLIVATVAPIVNSITLIPQLYKTYITKRVKDLSLFSLLLILANNILWVLHGYFIMDISLMVACVGSITINIALLILFFLYRKNRRIK
jgi:MtN3 and saliva related transmembrane protein